MSADFYDLLDLPEDASQDEIRDAYRSKVREYHPDHNDDPRANAQFTALKKAYDTLGDPVERNAYDRMGHLDYVSKRLSGLPDPDQWAPAGSDASSGSSGSIGSSTSSASRSSRSSSGRSSTSSGRSSSATSSSTRSASTSTRSSGSTGSGAGSASGTSSSSGRRTASDGAGTATHGHVAYEVDPVVEWIARHDRVRTLVGWEGIWLVLGIYAASMLTFAVANREPVADLLGRLLAAGADGAALWDALGRESMPVVAEAVVWPLVDAGAGRFALASGILLLVAALLFPAAVGVLVYVTRTTPGWKPTWAYVAATTAPLVGILAGLATTPPLWLELVLFVGLPLGAVVVMLLSAFVRPRVLIFLHNVRN